MSLCNLSERCKKIVNVLLRENSFISMQKIAEITGVSKRSVYYDICNINEWLEEREIKELEIERGKGIMIPPADRIKIEELLEERQLGDYYVFSPSERVKIIICYIIHSKKPVYIDQIMEVCQVSRNTVFGDMRVVVQTLHEYDLELKYESKKGYKVAGDVIRTRALFFLYFNTIRPLFDSGVLIFFNREEIQEYYKQLCLLRDELKIEYIEGDLLAIAALLPVMHNNTEKLCFQGLRKNEILESKEFQLVRKYFVELEESEKIYLCLHLLGSRVSVATDEIFEDRADQSVYGITKALVTEFEKTACVDFEDKEELERALFVHIKTSMYRYQYGIQIGNPMGDDITREYPNLFEITKTVSKYLEQMVGLPIPDSEVAYLALHFGAHLKISKFRGDRLRVLIVCANGISTGNMIKREVKKLLPEAEIVDVVAAINVFNAQDICDLVISTVKIKSVLPVIVVNAILSDEDRKSILNHQLVYNSQKNRISDTLFDVIKKYVDESQYEDLKRDIVRCLQGETESLDMGIIDKTDGILERLSMSKVIIRADEVKWQDSIYLTGKCLVQSGSIEERYLDIIISQTMYYGPYMFITDEIMLAHAKPEDGVNKMDISMAVFQNPVAFPKGKKAKIIFLLGAEDHEKHLKILNDILKIAEDTDRVKRLTQIDTCEEVFEVLRNILE
ncbi:MAG: BglG family transcription antiterminator [Lachnospiraceae bacterium]|nr:BglG family transcription antiterminator [Lachnospiraceae bacterium]